MSYFRTVLKNKKTQTVNIFFINASKTAEKNCSEKTGIKILNFNIASRFSLVADM